MKSHNNHISRWRHKGIPIRMKSTGYLMHNKFVIIDDEALLTGSLNWTVQGVTGNRENVLLTTDTRLVGAYRQEFIKMWNEFSDV
ncbi:unnamed protein product [Allacma fusca]|uniref:Mitochondrial cardiolipin hydrolase n=1 Tax=Allacma fusca TaxID=39272 RepID=A0A8J2P867_9HEXA|nr:unnamed protein product [Allacma fusca]